MMFVFFLVGVLLLSAIASRLDPVMCAEFDEQSPLLNYLDTQMAFDAWLDYPKESETPQWGVRHGFIGDYEPEKKERIFHETFYTSTSIGGIEIYQNKDFYYLFVYQNILPGGDPYGKHPCGAFLITPEQVYHIQELGQ